ncbi:hypothetical protein QTN47_26345 [Danxiaibacter flavus]|uniref:Uncharacterized protein n=1 Tax=Danxiaibacter flavus TaxID=3049108 RepID=A0ABV3ZML2_9BACT|nr:hypothetical protein QNM32_26345 [Chitinophagaceae bacterium DXS]
MEHNTTGNVVFLAVVGVMKKLLLAVLINLIVLGLHAQESDIENAQKIRKEIDASKNLKLLKDTVLFTDTAFIINTYFIDAKNGLKKTIQVTRTKTGRITKYKLDTLNKEKPLNLQLAVDTSYTIHADLKKTTTYYFSDKKLLMVTSIEYKNDAEVLNGTYYFGAEKRIIKADEKKEAEIPTNIARSKYFHDNVAIFFIRYPKLL